MATFSFSDPFSDATSWTTFAPDHNGMLLPLVGNDTAADRNACSCTIVNMSKHTPTLVAFIDSQEPDVISFAHSGAFCPNDLTHDSAHDDHVVAIMGDNSGHAVSVTLATSAFSRATNVRCLRLPEAANCGGRKPFGLSFTPHSCPP